MTSSTKPTDKSRTKRSSFESWPGEQDATPSNEKRNDAEARERARKRWKKVKHGVLATRGFAEGLLDPVLPRFGAQSCSQRGMAVRCALL